MPDQPAYTNYLIPQSATSIIPQQMGNDYLSNLENQLNLQEQQQMDQLLASQNQLGAVSSGNTDVGLADITGNTQNQFAQAATGLANQGASQANQQQFQQQYEQQGFQNQLTQLQQQYENQRSITDLMARLGMGPYTPNPSLPSFGAAFGQALAHYTPQAAGQFAYGAGNAAFSSPWGGGGMTGSSIPSSLNLPQYNQAFMNPALQFQPQTQLYSGMMNTGGQ